MNALWYVAAGTDGCFPGFGVTKNASAAPSGVSTLTIRLAVAAGGARLDVAAVVGPGVGSGLWAAREAGAQPVSSEATTAPAPMPASRRLSREF